MSAPARRLTRAALGLSAPPVRLVHLGLGAFHRAHQAWYTARASDAAAWGIAAFTGRSRDLFERLAPQDGLYTLVERAADGDRFEVVPSIVSVGAGNDVAAFVAAVADPEVGILTVTITEAGYRLTPDGSLDLADHELAADLDLVRHAVTSSEPPAVAPATALGRILLALDTRRRTGGGPITLVSCDNLPDNGGRLARALAELADRSVPELVDWWGSSVSVVSTSVDRITPAIEVAGISAEVAAATGYVDAAPVVTEPFSDWILAGEFLAGRPNWESAGARFVDDLQPWEHRKLWMLNGAHTVLAALGQVRGHAVVATAIDDPVCRAAVEALWDDAAGRLTEEAGPRAADLDLTGYRRALTERFRNPRMEHRLAQIGIDATTKMRLRIVPVALGARAAGRPASGCAAAVAAWVLGVRADVIPLPDGAADTSTVALLDALDPRVAADVEFAASVESALLALEAPSPFPPVRRDSRIEHS